MDVLKVDLEKIRDLANVISGDVVEYMKKQSIKTAEVLLALDEVSYRFGIFSQTAKDAPSLKPLRTSIV